MFDNSPLDNLGISSNKSIVDYIFGADSMLTNEKGAGAIIEKTFSATGDIYCPTIK